MPHRILVAAGLVAALAGPAFGDGPAVDFSRDVLPILSENCLVCHGPDAAARKADLRLDVRESALRATDPIIEPGNAEESELIVRLVTDDAEDRMPPVKSGKTLTAEQIETLSRWIDQGATWGEHWAFETPKRPNPPAVRDESRVRDPIDRFILARLEREGLEPAPEADGPTLIRRATLDLIGVPPTIEEVDAFLADDRPDAYERLVDRLLASPLYGQTMATDWLDAARYADTNGYQNDFARSMWPWRDWVVSAFNRNMPYDRFVVEQIAGDKLPGATLEQKVATGFNRNNRTVTEAGSIDEEYRIENAIDRVETTSTAFLGLTMGCARCHDHKYDPITQREFYEFLGFFNDVNEKGVYTETRGNVPPLIAVPTDAQRDDLARLDVEIAEAVKDVRRAESTREARQAEWEERARSLEMPPDTSSRAFRCELAGRLPIDAVYRGAGDPRWVDGPAGPALALDGKPASFVEVGPGPNLARDEPFTITFWVRPLADGACLSKMDDAAGFRGYDAIVAEGGKIALHLIHAWPGDAIKVKTKGLLPREAWAHVGIAYDGSGKAAGVTMYVNSKPVELEVEADSLRGDTATDQPFRIGSRSTSLALHGELADVRVVDRAMAIEDVGSLYWRRVLEIVQTPAGDRNAVAKATLAQHFRLWEDGKHAAAVAWLDGLKKMKADIEQAVPTVMIMEDAPERRPLHLLKRGLYDQPDASVSLTAGVPACLPPLPSGSAPDRLALARWLVAPENPLTARVAVNRVWQRHFGEGLVKSAENFGLQGEPPTHPVLLDWLATELVRDGWNVKALQRRIVLSATYRQASRASADLVARDPENRLLARGPRHRLDSETLRDNALAIAGLLSPHFGGPSIKPYQPEGLWEELAGGAGEGPYVQDKGEKLYRRSLYVYRKRTVPHPVMATFDAPSREICLVKRARTNTPLQALELLNDAAYVEAARNLAARMIAEGGPTAEGRVVRGFRLATAREPNPDERRALMAGLSSYLESFRADPDAASVLLRHGESPAPEGVDPVELAAYSATAAVILNLDETITRE